MGFDLDTKTNLKEIDLHSSDMSNINKIQRQTNLHTAILQPMTINNKGDFTRRLSDNFFFSETILNEAKKNNETTLKDSGSSATLT